MEKYSLLQEKKRPNFCRVIKKTGIHRMYLSEIEMGKRNPTVQMIYKIANALEIMPYELFLR